MNPKATKAANDDFYQNHPEMIQDGKRIPIDSCNPTHAKYQKEWMDSYVEHGGKIRIGKEQKQCGQPVHPCPCNGRLVVIFNSAETKKPISGAQVKIYGPSEAENQTDTQGRATFEGLLAGSYIIEAHITNQGSAEKIGEVQCLQTTGVILELLETRKMKKVPWKWVEQEQTLIADKGLGPGQVIKIKTIYNVILEWKMVPEDFALMKMSADELESGLWGSYNTYSIKRCKGEYRKQDTLDKIERIGWFGMEVLGVLLGQSPDLKAAVWYDGWNKYPGGRMDKYRSKNWDSLR